MTQNEKTYLLLKLNETLEDVDKSLRTSVRSYSYYSGMNDALIIAKSLIEDMEVTELSKRLDKLEKETEELVNMVKQNENSQCR